MCGIFGTISLGSKPDLDLLAILACLNEARGPHSFGFMSETSFIKRKGSITSAYPETWINSNDNSRYIFGHTRYATRGARNRRNAHPFFYSNVHEVGGVHNGVVPAPDYYNVDSQWIFDELSWQGIEALDYIGGRWGLAFTLDGDTYLAAYNQELSICKLNGVLYFSSDVFDLEDALELAGTDADCIELDNVLLRINKDNTFTVYELEALELWT